MFTAQQPHFYLKNDAVLEDGDLAEAVLLGLGLLAAGHPDDQIQQILCGLVDGLLAVGDDAGVEIDPARLLLRQRGVGGDLQGGSRGRERGAAAGGEMCIRDREFYLWILLHLI